jgi:hypothetical protein
MLMPDQDGRCRRSTPLERSPCKLNAGTAATIAVVVIHSMNLRPSDDTLRKLQALPGRTKRFSS